VTSFAGFDTSVYPGDAVMALLKPHFTWCCSYMVAPSHPEGDWTAADGRLIQAGWSLLDIYVGQQVTGPGSHRASALQGMADAGDAVRQMIARGRAFGLACVLDNEQGPPLEDPMLAYDIAWARRVAAEGFKPIIYASHLMAKDIAEAIPEAGLFIYDISTIARTTASPPFPTPDMSTFGCPQAIACQFRQNVALPDFGIVVDLDVAATADPAASG
jgi:hypothetical protein